MRDEIEGSEEVEFIGEEGEFPRFGDPKKSCLLVSIYTVNVFEENKNSNISCSYFIICCHVVLVF